MAPTSPTSETTHTLPLVALVAAAALLPVAGGQTLDSTVSSDDVLQPTTPMTSLDGDLVGNTTDDLLTTNVTFLQAAAGTPESAGEATIDVEATEDSDLFPANVTYNVTGGTADAADFSGGHGTLEFTEPGQVRTIHLTLHDDGTHEDDETVDLILSSDDLHVRWGIRNHTHTLVDDDPANLAPEAPDHGFRTPEGTTRSGTLPGSDPDGDPLTWSVAVHPSHGSLEVEAGDGSFTYAPDPGYTGSDAFEYMVLDGAASDTGTVDVTVEPADDGAGDDGSQDGTDDGAGDDGIDDGTGEVTQDGTSDGRAPGAGTGASSGSADAAGNDAAWWIVVGTVAVMGCGGALAYGYYRSEHGGF